MTPAEREELREILEQERLRLMQAEQVARDSATPNTLDKCTVDRLSRVDALQVREMAAESGRRRQVRQQQVEAALERIEGERYGSCRHCGENIDFRRLKMDPAAQTCIRCAP